MIKKEIEKILAETRDKAELIIAVKYANVEQIKEVISIHPNIGFNTYQQFKEISEKIDLENVKTHFIGNIQANKIRKIIELNPSLIQSINSLELAEKINQICIDRNKIQNVLLQVNSDPDKKSGFSFEEFENNLENLRQLKNVNMLGIMTIPSEKERIGEEKLKEIFRNMKNLREKNNLQILSMGMSNDYLLAIENGSNMIRVGRRIFS
jgi:pyridoxal phosphate enzyme (YggS family)